MEGEERGVWRVGSGGGERRVESDVRKVWRVWRVGRVWRKKKIILEDCFCANFCCLGFSEVP